MMYKKTKKKQKENEKFNRDDFLRHWLSTLPAQTTHHIHHSPTIELIVMKKATREI